MSQGTRVARFTTVRKRNHAYDGPQSPQFGGLLAVYRLLHECKFRYACTTRGRKMNLERDFSVIPPCFGFKFHGFSRSFICELLLEGVWKIVLEL